MLTMLPTKVGNEIGAGREVMTPQPSVVVMQLDPAAPSAKPKSNTQSQSSSLCGSRIQHSQSVALDNDDDTDDEDTLSMVEDTINTVGDAKHDAQQALFAAQQEQRQRIIAAAQALASVATTAKDATRKPQAEHSSAAGEANSGTRGSTALSARLASIARGRRGTFRYQPSPLRETTSSHLPEHSLQPTCTPTFHYNHQPGSILVNTKTPTPESLSSRKRKRKRVSGAQHKPVCSTETETFSDRDVELKQARAQLAAAEERAANAERLATNLQSVVQRLEATAMQVVGKAVQQSEDATTYRLLSRVCAGDKDTISMMTTDLILKISEHFANGNKALAKELIRRARSPEQDRHHASETVAGGTGMDADSRIGGHEFVRCAASKSTSQIVSSNLDQQKKLELTEKLRKRLATQPELPVTKWAGWKPSTTASQISR